MSRFQRKTLFFAFSAYLFLHPIFVLSNVIPFNVETKSLNLQLSAVFNDIDGYGCWCHFGENWRKGQGQPVDVFDQECANLFKGYQCISMDTETEEGNGFTCLAYETQYLEPLQISFDTPDEFLINDCESKNIFGNDSALSTCRVRSCIVESFFIRNLAIHKFSGEATNDEFLLENGFDYDSQCFVKKIGRQEKACCGNYPSRFPYQTRGGDFQCCGENLPYNSVLFQCCDDGVPRLSCP